MTAALADAAPSRPSVLKIALLHLEPQLGELDSNCGLCESAMEAAAAAGAKWILTPELGLTGYRFDQSPKLGGNTDWIKPGPDRWVERLRSASTRLGVTLFLGHLERDATDGHCYNTVFAIGPNGAILGRHRKINTIPIAEGWSTPGSTPAPIMVDDISVGVLICADSWPPTHANTLAKQGAQILFSSATWPPKPHGPETCWQQRTRDTGLPLLVCNRTGIEKDFDMRDSESVVVSNGKRLLRHSSEHSSIVLVDWDLANRTLVRHEKLRLGSGGGWLAA